MDKFKFRLDKVLDIKLKEEEESKLEHAKALKDKIEVQNELDNLKSKFRQYSDMQDIEDVVRRKIISNYLSSLYSSIEEIRLVLEEKQNILEEKQKELIHRQLDRKSIEKLKEKAYNVYKKELDLKEQNQNDEYALQSYIRLQDERR